MTQAKRLKYTYGIIYCAETCQVLLLNRQKSPWMGRWNAVGGKLESDEFPSEGMQREAEEETGLQNLKFIPRGVTRWTEDGVDTGGMYVFTAMVDKTTVEQLRTPLVIGHEGILDWKDMNWILDLENTGIVESLKKSLNFILKGSPNDLILVHYRGKDLSSYEYKPRGNTDFPII